MHPDLLDDDDGSSERGYDFFLFLSFPFFFFATERTLDIRAPAIPRASVGARLIDGKKRDAFCRLTEHPARKVRPNDSFERSARAVKLARARIFRACNGILIKRYPRHIEYDRLGRF